MNVKDYEQVADMIREATMPRVDPNHYTEQVNLLEGLGFQVASLEKRVAALEVAKVAASTTSTDHAECPKCGWRHSPFIACVRAVEQPDELLEPGWRKRARETTRYIAIGDWDGLDIRGRREWLALADAIIEDYLAGKHLVHSREYLKDCINRARAEAFDEVAKLLCDYEDEMMPSVFKRITQAIRSRKEKHDG